MPTKGPESFEVTEYSDNELSLHDKWKAIYEIVEEKGHTTSADFGLRAQLQGNLLRLTYHAYEMHAPIRMKQIEEKADTALRELVKELKKEFKSRVRKPLDLKEKKEHSNYTVQKVNLHERYHYAAWRVFEMG